MCIRDSYRIGHIRSGWMAIGARTRPRNTRPCSAKERRTGDDFITDAQWHVTPIRPPAVQVRPVHEIADADHRAVSEVRKALEMIDEVLASEVLLRHRAIPIVLVTDVTMQIDFCWHDSLPSYVYTRCACRDLQLTSTSNLSERVALDDECGVLDGRSAVAGDQACALKDDDVRTTDLCRRREHQKRRNHDIRGEPLQE